MARKSVSTNDAPPARGPYSQAIVAQGRVFCSGRPGIDPATGSVPDGIEAQTEQAMQNLGAVLTAAGSSLDQLVKTTICYADIADFATLNEGYGRYKPTPPLARSAAADIRLPRGLPVSIDAIATLDEAGSLDRRPGARHACVQTTHA